jgi:hypothetical protein
MTALTVDASASQGWMRTDSQDHRDPGQVDNGDRARTRQKAHRGRGPAWGLNRFLPNIQPSKVVLLLRGTKPARRSYTGYTSSTG